MAKKNDNSRLVKGVAIGGAIAALAGYVAGVLTAPKSGKETRQDIKGAADRTRLEAEKELKKLHTDLDTAIKEAKKQGGNLSKKAQVELDELIEKAKDTKEKAREVISAIHEGDAEDQDLKRAVKNANSALEHLKEYLKK